jgi:uncharacterized protein (TIGR00106 family)
VTKELLPWSLLLIGEVAMLAFFSIVPMGAGASVGDRVADAIKIVAESGLDYQVTAMGTLVEGDWDEVMGVIRRCFDAMHEHSDRVTCTLKIDDYKGRSGRIAGKIASVERALGREVDK